MKNTRKKQSEQDEATKEQDELSEMETTILEVFRNLDEKTKFYMALYSEVIRISGYTNSKLPDYLFEEFRNFEPEKRMPDLGWLTGIFDSIKMINACS